MPFVPYHAGQFFAPPTFPPASFYPPGLLPAFAPAPSPASALTPAPAPAPAAPPRPPEQPQLYNYTVVGGNKTAKDEKGEQIEKRRKKCSESEKYEGCTATKLEILNFHTKAVISEHYDGYHNHPPPQPSKRKPSREVREKSKAMLANNMSAAVVEQHLVTQCPGGEWLSKALHRELTVSFF